MFVAILKSMRPRQWAKNVFLFAAMVFDRKLTNPEAATSTLAGVVVFSVVASAVYLLNDIADVESDRRHPTKRLRPIAAGELPLPVAWLVVIVLLGGGLPAAYALSPGFFWLVLIYFLLNLTYSAWLKHIVLLDILVLASFYVLRVAAGVSLVDVQRFSPWIYIFTTFLALLIGAGKRRAELAARAEGVSTRRVLDGYTLPFLDQVIALAAGMTIITYSLYTFSAPNLPQNHAMMLTIPFVMYGVLRYQYLLQVRNIGGAPEEVVFSDRPLQAVVMLYGLVVVLIFYIF